MRSRYAHGQKSDFKSPESKSILKPPPSLGLRQFQ
jgi:hypothetical protein